jgi:membrane-associated phospholipid phosphatase
MGAAFLRQYMVAGTALFLLFLLMGRYVQANSIDSMDVAVFNAVNSSHSDFADVMMRAFSLYGREVVWGGIIVGLFFFGGKQRKKTAITLVIVFLVLMGVGFMVKEAYSRPRPYDAMTGVRLIVDEESDGSYPSGHTFIVVAGVVVVWRYLKRAWAASLTLEAALVAYSRVYVGVHYPSDILGGVLLGAGVSLIICAYPQVTDRIYEALPGRLRENLLVTDD